MSMDTLKAAKELESAGFDEKQAAAISRVINDFGRSNLVTKEYLDVRLLQHTVAVLFGFATIAGLFRLFA